MISTMCSLLDQVLGDFIYTPTIQTSIAQSNYFRDPFRISDYLSGCSFLPSILDNATKEQGDRLRSLYKLVLIMADRDTMIVPKETAVFGFFADRSYKDIVHASEQPWYHTLKLDALVEEKKLVVESTEGDHLRFSISQLHKWVDNYFL